MRALIERRNITYAPVLPEPFPIMSEMPQVPRLMPTPWAFNDRRPQAKCTHFHDSD